MTSVGSKRHESSDWSIETRADEVADAGLPLTMLVALADRSIVVTTLIEIGSAVPDT